GYYAAAESARTGSSSKQAARKNTESTRFETVVKREIKLQHAFHPQFWPPPARTDELAMVPQCANPACRAPLRYLRDGRLFQFEVRAIGFKQPGQPHHGDPTVRQGAFLVVRSVLPKYDTGVRQRERRDGHTFAART